MTKKTKRDARYGVRSIYKEQSSRQGRAAMTDDQKDKTGCQIWGSKHLQRAVVTPGKGSHD